MRPFEAELVATVEFLPGRWLRTYEVPRVASAAQPGQYVHVTTPGYGGIALRRPYPIYTYDRARGLITIQLRAGTDAGGAAWLAHGRPGDRHELHGPLGQAFEVDPRARHLLLIAAGDGIAGVRALADEALAANRHVVLLFGAASAAEVYPSSLLPDEVEYVVATADGTFGHHGSLTDLVARYEAWADQAFASGPHVTLAALAQMARGRQGRLGVAQLGARRRTSDQPRSGTRVARRRAWLQVGLEQTVGCAVGACLGCVIMGADGPQRVCREGPVFAAEEVVWEARWP